MSLITNALRTVSKLAGRTGLILRAASPEIYLVAGIAGGIGTVVLACVATKKSDDIKARHLADMDDINHCWEEVKAGERDIAEYSEADHKKDLAIVYTRTAKDYIVLYGPAVTLGVLSIACIIASHGILRKRNAALIAAYKTVESAFTSYRKRVVEEYGQDKDYMFKNGIRAEQITTTEVDEKGKKHKVETTQYTQDPNGLSMYARFFDEFNPLWKGDATYNKVFLRAQQNYWNDMLRVRGHVFLNEVYDALGFDRTQEGAVVGWVSDSENGDKFIDFNMYDGTREAARDFINGSERSILLDFNVDGVIWKLFTKKTV